jgi:hypothetical protein
MQLEADMYATDKSWQIIFAYFSNLEILNNKAVECIAYFTGHTQATTVILLLGSLITSLLPFPLSVLGVLLLKGNPVSFALYVAYGFTENPKSASSLK